MDEIVSRYRLDAQGWITGAQQIEKGTDELISDNKKLETSFGEVNKTTAKAFNADGVKQFNKEAVKALKDVKKSTDDVAKSNKSGQEALRQYKAELKEVKGQMAILVAQGKEASQEFIDLAKRAGQLDDAMGDLGDSIKLQAGDPLENLSTGFGQLKGSISQLDFEGVSRSLAGLGANVGKIDLNTFKDGIGGIAQGFIKLSASILMSPLFLVGAAVAGIVAVIVNWGDSLEEIRAKNDKLIAGIDKRLSITTAGYDAEIILLEAAGEKTDEIEKKKLAAVIRATEQKIRLRQKELAFEEDAAIKIGALFGETEANKVRDASEASKELTDLQNELTVLNAELLAVDIKANKDAEKTKLEDTKKANDQYKKLLDERLKEGIKKFNESIDRERFEEQQREQQDIIDSNKKIDDIIASTAPKRAKVLSQLEKDLIPIRRQALEDVFNDETQSFEKRQAALEEALEKQLITEQEFADKTKDLTNEKIDARKAEFDAIIQLGNDLLTTTQNFAQIAAELGMENAEGQKALALFGIGLDLAQSLGNAIFAATEAGVFTGAAAPFTIIAFIAQLTAAISGAFAQSFALANKPVPQFYGGGWTGDGGKFQPAGVVHAGEWVSTKEDTNRYWDELNAIHDGTFDDLLMYKYIGPALENAVSGFKESQNKSFAENIANSMMMNAMFKDGNILNALMKTNNDEGKRHKQLVNAIKKAAPRTTYRKK